VSVTLVVRSNTEGSGVARQRIQWPELPVRKRLDRVNVWSYTSILSRVPERTVPPKPIVHLSREVQRKREH